MRDGADRAGRLTRIAADANFRVDEVLFGQSVHENTG
jgi:hypothetical protein